MESVFQDEIKRIKGKYVPIAGIVNSSVAFHDREKEGLELIVDPHPLNERTNVRFHNLRIIFDGYAPAISNGDTILAYINLEKGSRPLRDTEEAVMIEKRRELLSLTEGYVEAVYLAKRDDL